MINGAYHPLEERDPDSRQRCRSTAVHVGIFCAWVLLELANLILQVVTWPAKCVCKCKDDAKHVVVVGASFG